MKNKLLDCIIVVIIVTIIYPITIVVGTCGGSKYLTHKES